MLNSSETLSVCILQAVVFVTVVLAFFCCKFACSGISTSLIIIVSKASVLDVRDY